MEKIKAKYVVIKTKDFASFTLGYTQLPTMIIDIYPKGKYSNFYPDKDQLIEDAEITVNNGVINIKGNEVNFIYNFGRTNYSNKYYLFKEYSQGKRFSKEEVINLIFIISKQKLKLKEEDIKLDYKTFCDRILNRKTYYVDATPEVISVFSFIKPENISKDEKGYYVEGWFRSTLEKEKPFEIETNTYTIQKHLD